MSVRERKAAAVRQALSEAALTLAVERGWEHVRVEDIAAHAGVSTRTFGNYFHGKNEALCAVADERAAQVRSTVTERPADEPLWTAVTHGVLAIYGAPGADDRAIVTRFRLAAANPQVKGELLRSQTELETALAESVADRLGIGVDDEIYPRLLAGVVVQTTRVAVEHWLRTDDQTSLAEVLTAALERVSAGLPEPSTR